MEVLQQHNFIYFKNSYQLIRRPSSDFLERLQTDVTQNMRAVLVDWLVEVRLDYFLHEVTQ